MVTIEQTDAAKQFGGTHYVISEDITRTFSATDFLEQGYADAVSAQQNAFIFSSPDTDVAMQKEVSKTTIQLYQEPLIDTSAITIINFGEEHTYFHVETVRNYPEKAG